MRAIGRVDGLPEEEIRHVTWVTKPDPLVPRERIIGVRERIDYLGQEVVPLNRGDVMDAIRRLIKDEKIEAIAVSLLHAWANPRHEEEIRSLALEADPSRKVFWSFGSAISQSPANTPAPTRPSSTVFSARQWSAISKGSRAN